MLTDFYGSYLFQDVRGSNWGKHQQIWNYYFIISSPIFSSPGQRPYELLPSLGARRLSVILCKLSHLNLLL